MAGTTVSNQPGVINVDTRHPLYDVFLPEYDKVDNCVEGERAVKLAGVAYLPRPATWEDVRYNNYRLRARFMNATGKTLSALIGIAMEKPLGVAIAQTFDYLREDSDGKGKSVNQLFRDALSENLKKGRGGILLDNTAIADNEYQPEQTVAQASRERWVLRNFNAKQIINWRTVNGKLTLLVLKYQEEQESDGFEFNPMTIWLEYRIVDGKCYGRVWKAKTYQAKAFNTNSNSADEKTDLLALTINGEPLTHIPFAWYGSENNDEVPDTPPLADLASLNIGHYQADADIAESAFIAGQPTVAVSGLTEAWAKNFIKKGVEMGATEGLLLPTGAKLEIVQAKETSASVTRQDRIESQMSKLGAKFIERGSGVKTATQSVDESQTDNSTLSQCVGNVEAAINLALSWVEAGTITANKRFVAIQVDSQALVAMMSAVQSNMMLIEDFIRWQQQIGLADPNATVEDIVDRLKSQVIDLPSDQYSDVTDQGNGNADNPNGDKLPPEQQPPQPKG